MPKPPVAIGASDHYGWAACVSVTIRNGAAAILDRRRIELIAPGLPQSPYHHDTLTMAADDAEHLVRTVRESAEHHAHHELAQLQAALAASGELIAIVLRQPPLPTLPESVAAAHASYHVQNRADGMIYHHALTAAAASLGIPVVLYARGDETTQAAKAAGTTPAKLDHYLAGLRATLGPPWQRDHREATARAIAVLGQHTKISLAAAE